MNRDISYILGLVSANEYEKLKQSVFRPGSLSLAESVFWYEENKNHPDDAFDESILAAEIERFCEESEYIDAVKEAGNIWALPVIDLNAVSGLYPMMDEYSQYFADPQVDRLHPNDKGHERMARTLYYQLSTLPCSF